MCGPASQPGRPPDPTLRAVTGPIVSARGLVRIHGAGDAARAVRGRRRPGRRAGELVAVVGPSGSGKSTLLHLLAGLDRRPRGTVTVAGRRLDQGSEAQRSRFRREHVGFVFQSFRLVPELTAWENALLPAAAGRQPRTDRRASARCSSASASRPHAAGCRRELSGGEQQRVAIARALVDGPAGRVRRRAHRQPRRGAGAGVMEVLRDAVGPRRAVVVVTHDARWSTGPTRVVELRDGALVRVIARRRWRARSRACGGARADARRRRRRVPAPASWRARPSPPAYALATGFDRAQRAAGTADVIARFDAVRAQRRGRAARRARQRPRALVPPRRAAGRLQAVRTACAGAGPPRSTALEPGHESDGLALVAGRGLSGAPGEAVVERGLADAWRLGPGDRLRVEPLARHRRRRRGGAGQRRVPARGAPARVPAGGGRAPGRSRAATPAT